MQIDTRKIRRGLYQFTAVDDCTRLRVLRLRVLRLYDARNGKNAVAFIAQMVDALPFALQRVQTDRGAEFIAEEFQKELRQRHIKFRPNRPRAPHLNGKVERSQQTDHVHACMNRVEFWATVDYTQPTDALVAALADWERHYNEARGHSAHGGKTPRQRYKETAGSAALTPEQVRQTYDITKEKWHTNCRYTWVLTGKSER